MKRSLSALLLLAASALPADAQVFSRNEIFNSGNGAHNAIRIINGVPVGYPAYAPGYPSPYVAYRPPYSPAAHSPPRFPLLQGLLQAVGGLNVNVIAGSGNGVGNSIFATNPRRPGGININIVAGSGNGAHNRIGIGR